MIHTKTMPAHAHNRIVKGHTILYMPYKHSIRSESFVTKHTLGNLAPPKLDYCGDSKKYAFFENSLFILSHILALCLGDSASLVCHDHISHEVRSSHTHTEGEREIEIDLLPYLVRLTGRNERTFNPNRLMCALCMPSTTNPTWNFIFYFFLCAALFD